MKKRWMTGWIIALASIAVFCACTHSGESDQVAEPTPETAKNVDEIIRDAEKNTYLSGDADEELLYTSGDLPFGSVVPAFLQPHTPDEFPIFDGDERFFRPASDDYLIASFEEGKTMIYEFFGDGSLIALRGRIVYETKEALLKENADKVLKEDDLSETGYTYHGNVLYYIMPQDALFSAEYRIDKQKLLKTASSGAWKEDLYWFSKPYDDPVSAFDAEKWDEILSILDAVIPDPEYAEPNEAEPADQHPLDEETVRELFTDLMKQNGKTPADYANSDLKIVMNQDGYAFASLLYYTVPETYEPGGKIENYLISAPLVLEESEETWVLADQKAFFQSEKETYYRAILTEGAYDAFQKGAFAKRLWVPFRPSDPVRIRDAVVGKVTEIYEAEDDELAVTLFFSNETEKDVRITSLDSLTLTCESGVVADVSANLDMELKSGQFMYQTVLIPPEYLSVSTFADANVSAFAFSVEE